MIELIKKTIIESKTLENSTKESNLDLLKYNTLGRDIILDGKVIFIVFEKKNSTPVLIVKTVRDYKYKGVISVGHKKLDELKNLLKDTKYVNLFPKPILLHDDGVEFTFSVESYNDGTRLSSNKKFLTQAINQYIDFQKIINKSETFVSLISYGTSIIKDCGLNINDESLLNEYLESLCKISGSEIALVDQHGDLTPDNIFIKDCDIKIIDCDQFGDIRLAGYDIYRLTMRLDPRSTIKSLYKYFNSLGLSVKPDKANIFLYYMHDLLFKRAYVLEGKSASDIISGFESEYKTLEFL